jgi:pyruvate kinase
MFTRYILKESIMKKLTKIVATIGPVSDSEEMIEKLIKAGVNIFRFNFKHNSVEWHSERIERVNAVSKRLNIPVGTLIDLQGPEIRVNMPVDQVDIKAGDLLLFGEDSFKKEEVGFSITHPEIIAHLKDGQKILVDDGAFSFHVVQKDGKTYLQSETTGTFKTRKTLNIPGADFPFPVLIDRDFEGLKLAARNDIDFVALSFVRSPEDLKVVRKEMENYKVKGKMVAKIETQKAINQLDEIIDETDAVMIARGDLGIEMPIEQVPYYQKLMIKKCLEKGKYVITATQMLQSMVTNPIPWRAEVSDVANAVYDLTDGVMLSAESAAGSYPLEAVEMMSKILSFYEDKKEDKSPEQLDLKSTDTSEMICESAYDLYLDHTKSGQEIAGFLVFTQSGKTAELMSRFRARVPVFTFTLNNKVQNNLTLKYGVYPFSWDVTEAPEVTLPEIKKVYQFLVEKEYIKEGAKLIVIHGNKWGVGAGATTIRVI